jgi:hypothetical protein
MVRILFLVIAVIAAILIVSWVVHALMLFFWFAVVAVAVMGLFRLGRWSSSRRARS